MQTTKASCITAVGVQHFSKVTVLADYLPDSRKCYYTRALGYMYTVPQQQVSSAFDSCYLEQTPGESTAKCRGESGCMQFFGQRLAQGSPDLSTFTAISSFISRWGGILELRRPPPMQGGFRRTQLELKPLLRVHV